MTADMQPNNRSAYIWNTAGSMLNAFQSVVMLMVLTRVTDLATSGIFTIAYANANLFLNMGNYGMRNYQASDVTPQYSFVAYAHSRLMTDLAMVACSVAYLVWSALTVGYNGYKIAVIFAMTLFKLIDSIEDVTDGNYQQHGRLDVGGKLQTLRLSTTMVVFAVSAVVTHDLLLPLCIATGWTFAVYVVGASLIKRRLKLPAADLHGKSCSAFSLLKECFPLFLAAFLLFYIGNAPKYAIDAYMDDASQAIYGFIAMPVFVVGLLAQFIYMPIIEPLANRWNAGDVRYFRKEIFKQALYIAGLTLFCDLGALFLGAPVLGALYNTDLSGYVSNLIVLVTGGGFLAVTTLTTMGITIMRQQKLLTAGYVFVALVALIVSPMVVSNFGISGASWIYLLLMVVLALWFGCLFLQRSSVEALRRDL